MSSVEEIEARAVSILGDSSNLLEKALDVIEAQKKKIVEIEEQILIISRRNDGVENMFFRAVYFEEAKERSLIDKSKIPGELAKIDTALKEIRRIGCRDAEKGLLQSRLTLCRLFRILNGEKS